MIHVFLTSAPEFTELPLVQRIFSQKDGNIFLLEGSYLIKRVTTWSWLCYNYLKLLLLFRKTMNSHTLKTTNTIKFTRILLKRKSNLTSLQINFLFFNLLKGAVLSTMLLWKRCFAGPKTLPRKDSIVGVFL